MSLWPYFQAFPPTIHRLSPFYDFFHRLWPGCNNFLPHLRYRRKKPPKGKGNGEKSPSFDKDHAATIIKYFDGHGAGGILKSKLSIIGKIFSRIFLAGSMHKGLLNTKKKRHRAKYICPKTKYAERLCLCDNRCTKSTYGRVVNINLKDDPRLFCDPPRGSPQWKQAYNKRTSAERANKRIKIDGLLEEGHHRSSMMWYIRLFAILSVIHVDAWHERKCESA